TSTATITVTDDADGSPHSISLSGTAVSPAPAVSLSDPALFFIQPVGSTSSAQAVTITNSGTAALTVASIALAGANPEAVTPPAPAGPLRARPGRPRLLLGHLLPARPRPAQGNRRDRGRCRG